MADEQKTGGDAKPAKLTGEAKARKWVDEHLAGGPLARNVDAWNEIQRNLPALAAIIDA